MKTMLKKQSNFSICAFIKILILAVSCSGVISYQTSPELFQSLLNETNSKPRARKMDSLFARIDEASSSIPVNLDSGVVIFETYDYPAYLELHSNKFYEHLDDKFIRNSYELYHKHKVKEKFILNPRFEIIYRDLGKYEDLDIQKFRYVIKTAYRLQDNPKRLKYFVDEKVFSPWQSVLIYYIFDRRDKVVYGALKDLKQFEK